MSFCPLRFCKKRGISSRFFEKMSPRGRRHTVYTLARFKHHPGRPWRCGSAANNVRPGGARAGPVGRKSGAAKAAGSPRSRPARPMFDGAIKKLSAFIKWPGKHQTGNARKRARNRCIFFG